MPTQAFQEVDTPSTEKTNSNSNKNNITNISITKELDYGPLLFIGALHLAALGGFFTFSWQALVICLILHWITGGLGITLGFHRLLTHRSFRVPKLLEYFFAFCGALAGQGGPITWVVAHRIHHTKSDLVGDPHSPRDGFWWAHMLWCVHKSDRLHNRELFAKVAPDLVQDPVYQFMNRWFIAFNFVLAAGLYALGGWPFIIWGIFVRMVLVYHCTWFVNSAAHVWGYRNYKTTDQSTNLWWVALLTYGEGWHNNHHAFQYSARHGLKWWEFDTTYLTIQFLKFFGLATAVKIPSKQLLSRPFAPNAAGVE